MLSANLYNKILLVGGEISVMVVLFVGIPHVTSFCSY